MDETEQNPPAPPDRKNVEPRTTAEQDLKTAGQRKINAIWEYTQSYVAIAVVTTTAIGVFVGRVTQGNSVPFPAEWWTIVGLVIGFYFGRTNHARIGDEYTAKPEK